MIKTQSRWKSPIVWGATLAIILIQLQQLSEKSSITAFDIAIAVVTVGIAFVAALNNPTDAKNL